MRSINVLLIVTMVSLTMMISMENSLANPAPLPETTIDVPDGSPTPLKGTDLKFSSEEINVWIDEYAVVECHYELINKVNISINETIALPFYKDPVDLTLLVNDIEIEYQWEELSFDLRFLERDLFNSIVFNVSAEPFDEINISVNYRRDITVDSYGNDRLYSFIYLARTGRMWKDPIDKAVFRFHVNRSLVEIEYNWGNFVDRVFGMDSVTKFDLMNIMDQTDTLKYPVDAGSGYFLLEREYFYWEPQKDVGIVWLLKAPQPSLSISGRIIENGALIELNGTGTFDLDSAISTYEWYLLDSNMITRRPLVPEIDRKISDELGINNIKHRAFVNETGLKIIELEVTDTHGLTVSAYQKVLFVRQGERLDVGVTDIDNSWEFYNEDFEYSWYMDGEFISREKNISHFVSDPGVIELEVVMGDHHDVSRIIKVFVLEDPEYENEQKTVSDTRISAISVSSILLILILVSFLLMIRKWRFGS